MVFLQHFEEAIMCAAKRGKIKNVVFLMKKVTMKNEDLLKTVISLLRDFYVESSKLNKYHGLKEFINVATSEPSYPFLEQVSYILRSIMSFTILIVI